MELEAPLSNEDLLDIENVIFAYDFNVATLKHSIKKYKEISDDVRRTLYSKDEGFIYGIFHKVVLEIDYLSKFFSFNDKLNDAYIRLKSAYIQHFRSLYMTTYFKVMDELLCTLLQLNFYEFFKIIKTIHLKQPIVYFVELGGFTDEEGEILSHYLRETYPNVARLSHFR